MNSGSSDDEHLNPIMKRTECTQEFACIESCTSSVCDFYDIGLADFVECKDEVSRATCVYGFNFGKSYFCNCPTRVYTAKNWYSK